MKKINKVLIVEDDPTKRDKLIEFMNATYCVDELIVKQSYNTGLHAINKEYEDIDIILLDMTMTTYEVSSEEAGGDPEPTAGYNILYAMDIRGIRCKVIVVTMYESFDGKEISALHNTLNKEFHENYKGYVQFEHNSNKWRELLKKKIDKSLNF